MWQVSGEKVERLNIAREPNYDLSDPNDPVKNWPVWTAYDAGDRAALHFADSQGPGRQGPVLNGAVIWTEVDFLMAAATLSSDGAGDYNPDGRLA